MTSGQFKSIAISDIIINRAERQRRELEGVEELAQSISRRGLIHPPVITRDLVLIAGERRVEAAKLLGYTHIVCQFDDDQDEAALQEVELEENIRRVDLPWQDRVKAVEKYHAIRKASDPKWTQDDTAAALGWKSNTIAEHLTVAAEIKKNKLVSDAAEYSTAKGIAVRSRERQAEAQLASIKAPSQKTDISPEALPPKPPERQDILNVSFLDWAPAYKGEPFNLIHCDFPYGINADRMRMHGQAHEAKAYNDSEDTYWRLCQCLVKHKSKLLGESAHVLFWFSMTHYCTTLSFLKEHFTVNPFPLIWYKDKGTLPDPSRGPRRVYEVAFLCSYGDRKIIRATDNVCQMGCGERQHMSEKAQPMLEYFFKMLVDGTTRLLDPTAGSGSSLRAAEALGAASVTGLELNPEFARSANEELNRWRKERDLGV